MRLKKTLGIIFLIALLSASPARANSTTVNDVAKELICLSGCNMVLSECTCCGEMGLYLEMMALVKQQVDAGHSKDEIIQFFVAQYGEQVLASPTKRGFNLTAWVLPFAALLFGGGVVYIALKGWVRRGKIRQTNAMPEAEEVSEEYRHRLKKELEEFTGRGFR